MAPGDNGKVGTNGQAVGDGLMLDLLKHGALPVLEEIAKVLTLARITSA